MAILLSSDLHANKISKNNLILAFHGYFEKINYHIVLSNAGLMRPGNEKKDYSTYKTLSFRPFPVLCLLDSHEPPHGKNIEEVDIGLGESVFKIHDNPFVAYLKRRKVYTIDGIKFLVLGGALLHDKEKYNLFKLLETDNKFDFVISYADPHKYDEIHGKIQFTEWWCSHQHEDKYYYDENTGYGYQSLHKRIKILEKADNKLILTNEYGMSNR